MQPIQFKVYFHPCNSFYIILNSVKTNKETIHSSCKESLPAPNPDHLRSQGLLGYVDGSSTEPPSTISDKDDTVVSNLEYTKWKQTD